MQSKQAGKRWPKQVDSYSTIGTKCRDRYCFPVAIRIPARMDQPGKFARFLLTLMALTVTMIYICSVFWAAFRIDLRTKAGF